MNRSSIALVAGAALCSACATAGAPPTARQATYSFEDGVFTAEWLGGEATVHAIAADGSCGDAHVSSRGDPRLDAPLVGATVVTRLTLCPAGKSDGFDKFRFEGDQQAVRSLGPSDRIPTRFELEIAPEADGSMTLRGGKGNRKIMVLLPAGERGDSLRAHPEIVAAAVGLGLVPVIQDRAAVDLR